MTNLQIEHEVPNYDGWKKAFDSDPIGRQKSGVKRYRVSRQSDRQNYIIIDLEFEQKENAEKMLTALKNFWPKVEGTVMMGPKARIIDLVENVEY